MVVAAKRAAFSPVFRPVGLTEDTGVLCGPNGVQASSFLGPIWFRQSGVIASRLVVGPVETHPSPIWDTHRVLREHTPLG